MIRFFRIFVLIFSTFLGAVEIALTIDDQPMSPGPLFSLKERTKKLLEACEWHSCKAAFFCVGFNCENEGQESLFMIDKAGHFLANHSMSHRHLSAISLSTFEKEIGEMDGILSAYSGARKWFRFPFLDYGNRKPLGGSETKTEAALNILKRLGHQEAFVTINTFDWHIQNRLEKALQKKLSVDYDKLRAVYVSLIDDWCCHYIELYQTHMPEKFPHTLLLHANDLNALFLDDILALISKNGWKMVSPEAAFQDTSWRKILLQGKLELITAKPPSLDIKEIDQKLKSAQVFQGEDFF